MKSKKRVLAFHLLNDYSGSPFVLSRVINGLKNNDHEVSLFTSKGQGFLSDISEVKYEHTPYKWTDNKLLTLINFAIAQIWMFVKVLFADSNSIIYINTVLPFGAAIAGKLRNLPVVYHVHEVTIRPNILKSFLVGVINTCSTEVIYVSKFVSQGLNIKCKNTSIIYNALSNTFIEHAVSEMKTNPIKSANVLLIASLKKYKGIEQFVELAKAIPNMQFTMVLNADNQQIDNYFTNHSIPHNLIIYPKQANVHPFYQEASVLLNLSLPDQWVETFGLTALEGMTYGLPVIVPQVGGIAEIVVDKITGYTIDAYDGNKLKSVIVNLHKDQALYSRLSQAALAQSTLFREDKMNGNIDQLISRTSRYQNEVSKWESRNPLNA